MNKDELPYRDMLELGKAINVDDDKCKNYAHVLRRLFSNFEALTKLQGRML